MNTFFLWFAAIMNAFVWFLVGFTVAERKYNKTSKEPIKVGDLVVPSGKYKYHDTNWPLQVTDIVEAKNPEAGGAYVRTTSGGYFYINGLKKYEKENFAKGR